MEGFHPIPLGLVDETDGVGSVGQLVQIVADVVHGPDQLPELRRGRGLDLCLRDEFTQQSGRAQAGLFAQLQ